MTLMKCFKRPAPSHPTSLGTTETLIIYSEPNILKHNYTELLARDKTELNYDVLFVITQLVKWRIASICQSVRIRDSRDDVIQIVQHTRSPYAAFETGLTGFGMTV